MKKVIPLIIIAFSAIQATAANADTLFRPRATFGFASYELAVPDDTTELSSTSYTTLGAGATLAVDRLYFDVAVGTSLDATYDSFAGSEEDFSRDDSTFTIGYILDDGFSIFGGIKNGSTEYTNFNAGVTTTTFDTSGPFFGVSKSFDGGLALNAAVAILEGELKDNDPNPASQFDETADTFGFSFGGSYVINFSSSAGLILKGAFQNYSFTDWSGNFIDNGGSLPDIDEQILSADVTLFVNF